MKPAPCPVCEGTAVEVLYPDGLGKDLPKFGYDFTPEHTRTYQVVLCKPCRHAFCSPRPADLWHEYEEVVDEAYLLRQGDRLATARKVIRQIRRFASSGRLLDIGCATGDFLEAAKEHYEVEGLELSGWAAEIARKRGFTVHRSDLAGFRPESPYDLLTLWGVIEHFEEPAREVRRMAQLLRPGGRVCLWTGDRDSWPARLLGKRWWYLQGQHLQIFSRSSLARAFTDAGFEMEWLGRYPLVMTLGSVGKSLQRYPALGPSAFRVLGSRPLSERTVTLALPGEMFAIFKRSER